MGITSPVAACDDLKARDVNGALFAIISIFPQRPETRQRG
jgi:hypothetical protein